MYLRLEVGDEIKEVTMSNESEFSDSRKVIELKVEPDLSDKHVMDALRDGIQFSKSIKCKSILIVIIPESSREGSFSRSFTRDKIGDVAQLFNLCKVILKLMDHCLMEMMYRED